jgi:Family of unknown function (DUF6221)
MTLTEFLMARLDEQAAKARRIAEATQGGTLDVWLTFHDGPERRSEERVDAYNPADVLADVDAKRRMVARIRHHASLMGEDEIHGDLLRLLALPYADHPDYDPRWASPSQQPPDAAVQVDRQ